MKKSPFVRSYWPRYKGRSLFFVIAMQIFTTLLVGVALIIAGVADVLDMNFWIMLIAILSASVGINIIVFSVISEPLRLLAHAIAHMAGEPTTEAAPNPNLVRFERNGLSPLLRAIYEKSLASTAAPKKKADKAFNFTSTLGEMSTGLVFMKSDGSIVFSNKTAPIRTTPEGVKQLDLIFDRPDEFDAWLKECEDGAVRTEKVWRRIATRLPGDEDRKVYDLVASYEKGAEVEVVLTLVDQTKQYLPEDNDLDFIAFAAHELRGPITVIRGYLDTLGDELGDRLTPDEVELFQRLIVSANRLSGYVNNILNAAKFDRRHLKVYLREDSIAGIYNIIADDMQLRARSQGRLLAVTFPDNLPSVAADRNSITEVIGNLIDNAIKYSNEGGTITVTAQAVANMVEVSVTDTGIGMPGNVVSNLFTKFYRSHRSRETVAGTGIGLYICKAIVESHGGQMGVRSIENQGSTFTFTLPIYATVAEKLKAGDNSNEAFIQQSEGWIKNHGAFRG